MLDRVKTALWTHKGRMGRLPFLGYQLLNWVSFVAILTMGIFIIDEFPDLSPSMNGIILVFIAISMIVALFLYGMANVCLSVKRLHDMALSGWHYLWLVALSISSTVFTNSQPDLSALFGLATLIGYCILLFVPGTDEPNGYELDENTDSKRSAP